MLKSRISNGKDDTAVALRLIELVGKKSCCKRYAHRIGLWVILLAVLIALILVLQKGLT